jgi:hypothetical protein
MPAGPPMQQGPWQVADPLAFPAREAPLPQLWPSVSPMLINVIRQKLLLSFEGLK